VRRGGVARELATDADRVLPGDGDYRLDDIVQNCAGSATTLGALELMNPTLWQVRGTQVARSDWPPYNDFWMNTRETLTRLGDHSFMFTLSAFADEISPDPAEQMAVLQSCGSSHRVPFDPQDERPRPDRLQFRIQVASRPEWFKLSAIGSPIGKIRSTRPSSRTCSDFSAPSNCARSSGRRISAFLLLQGR